MHDNPSSNTTFARYNTKRARGKSVWCWGRGTIKMVVREKKGNRFANDRFVAIKQKYAKSEVYGM